MSLPARMAVSVLLLFFSGPATAQTFEPANGDVRAKAIHVAIDLDVLRILVPNPQRMEAILTRHTTPEQAAVIFRKVSPRLAVFSHSPGTAGIVQETMRFYSGPVEMGTDLMVIDIGDEVRVRPVAPAAARRW